MTKVINVFKKGLFIIAHQIGDHRFYPTYKKMVGNQWKTFLELQNEQEVQLRSLIEYSYSNVPYYNRLFKRLNLRPENIRTISDLEKLPILTKDIIQNNWDDFKPIGLNNMKYYIFSTGGSTGTPFKYRLDKFNRFLSGALWYRGWGYAGYDLGDRAVFMGGSSLGVNAKSEFIKRVHETTRNIRKLSSFDMSDNDLKNYADIINKFKPKYIYGYASSLYFFSKWIEDNGISIHSPIGIFSTAEMLYPAMRKGIESAFNGNLYDTYGLNDGCVSAYECTEHSGLHIDMERSVMEIIDSEGHQLDSGEGRILATSLYNYTMPFIRYDTGDIGHIIPDNCNCGRGYRLLKKLIGRSVDILVTPEGKNVHGWFFLYIFWEHCKGIKEYQVVQKNLNTIIIKIVPNSNFDKNLLNEIETIIKTKSKSWKVEFELVDNIERTYAGKYKFIINTIGA